MTTTKQRPSARTMLAVDFPRQGETVTSPHYAVRLSAPEDAAQVEISVDQGDWIPCRKAAGYWWHDWSGYGEGEHEVVARIQVAGKLVSSEPHGFRVELPR